MNRQNIPTAPDEGKIEELLAKIQSVPSERFHQKMKRAAWRTENFGSQAKSAGLPRVRLALAMTVLLLLAGLLITPQGRAWAQEIVHFFNRINSFTVELPESYRKWMEDTNSSYDLPLVPVFIPTISPEMAALSGCGTPQKSQSYSCQVKLAESRLGFDLRELPAKPEEWKFDSLYFDVASKTASIGYTLDHRYQSYGTLQLVQGLGDFPKLYPGNPWEAVPADKVETVKVGSYDGEYVKGSFGTSTNNNLTWSDLYRHRLAWSDGTKWYLIELRPNPNPPDKMSREQLIELAESLVDSPQEKTKSPDPNALYSTLYSISEAEAISGFDLKAPTMLPLDINFEYAHYYSYKNEVYLFYGINSELVIHEWKGASLDLDKISSPSNTNYKIVKINSENAFYGFVEGSSPYLFLWWQKDGMNYQMYYYQYFGRTIEKEELIVIAESMQDIDDFRTKNAMPYEYISIYEQALGFDVREFVEPPAGWSFASVYADPYGPCILLIYKQGTTPGWLLINQCNTDKYFNVSDIPSRVIQQVWIGKNKGMYAAGDFVTSNDGKLTWNPALPLRRLSWQEDGLWMEMIVSGEGAILHDKEDLISYAESLR